MARNPTHGRFADVLAAAKPEQRPICQALRRGIAALHREHVEVVWPRQKIASFGVGPRKMTDHYAYIMVAGSHVNVGFYHGAALPDPAGLLEGTGKALRHVKVRTLAEAKAPALRALLRTAIADRQRRAG